MYIAEYACASNVSLKYFKYYKNIFSIFLRALNFVTLEIYVLKRQLLNVPITTKQFLYHF
jgi:hypothetical protein